MGIINSYVIDKIEYLNKKYGINIQFIALISIRDFFINRKKIKASYPKSLILPHFPKTRFYALNLLFLVPIWLFWGSNKVIAKNIFSAALARSLKKIGLVKTLIYDAEGAAYGEKVEFGIGPGLSEESIKNLEKNAIQNADLIRTVSHKMPHYWNESLGVDKLPYTVIPCTISQNYLTVSLDSESTLAERKKLGFNAEDIIFIYAGSFSPWQGFELIDELFMKLLEKHPQYKLLILSNIFPNEMKCYQSFPECVQVTYVDHAKVPLYLSISDYGLLLRNRYITNKVAAPTKFAEYLACGLKILISPEVGDYTEFVETHDCGLVVNNINTISGLSAPDLHEKKAMQELSLANFTNEAFSKEFRQIITI